MVGQLAQKMWIWINATLGVWGKVIMIWVILITFVGICIAWRSDHITTDALQDMLESRAISVAQDVADRSIELVYTNNLYELHALITHTMENYHDLVYLFLQDKDGEVLVYAYPGDQIPQELVEFNGVSYDGSHHIGSFQSETGIIHDIAVPIYDGRAGTVRLGIEEAGLREIAAGLLRSLNVTILFAFIIGILITIMLAETMVSPLRQLTAATKAVTAGDFSVRVTGHAPDEMGQLADSFNQMAERLCEYKTENEMAREELERKERLRIQLVKRLIAAQEEERKRISRELHDETSQSLSALKLGLKAIEEASPPGEVRELSNELRAILTTTMAEIYILSRELRPSALDDMGLNAALAKYTEKCSGWLGKKISFRSEGLEPHRFPFYFETAVFRIVQEALTNARKYARAKNISVLVRYRDNVFTAIIADDGVGFTPNMGINGNEHHGGLGLFGMQERAFLIGGTLEIESAPGQGTSITLTVPIG